MTDDPNRNMTQAELAALDARLGYPNTQVRDDSTIAPALTPEQWPYGQEVIAHHESGKMGYGVMAVLTEHGGLALDVRGPRPSEFWDVSDRHALAALCLYGQPFGFTSEDVEIVRRVANGCDGTLGTHDEERVFPDAILIRMGDVRRLWSLADRIAALLPPDPLR